MDRPLQIVFRDIERRTFPARLVRERAQRLEHFYSHIIGCRVVAEASHRGPKAAPQPISVAVEVEVPGRRKIMAKSDIGRHGGRGRPSGVINRVFDSVQRQLEELSAILRGDVKRR